MGGGRTSYTHVIPKREWDEFLCKWTKGILKPYYCGTTVIWEVFFLEPGVRYAACIYTTIAPEMACHGPFLDEHVIDEMDPFMVKP